MGREEKKDVERRRKSQEEIDNLFARVPIQSEDVEQELSESDEVCDPSDDSDWEDMDNTVEKETKKYNTMSLQYFARECDRYGVSDRAGAKIGNGLLKDLGIVAGTDSYVYISRARSTCICFRNICYTLYNLTIVVLSVKLRLLSRLSTRTTWTN